jgi:hypothetical protein
VTHGWIAAAIAIGLPLNAQPELSDKKYSVNYGG